MYIGQREIFCCSRPSAWTHVWCFHKKVHYNESWRYLGRWSINAQLRWNDERAAFFKIVLQNLFILSCRTNHCQFHPWKSWISARPLDPWPSPVLPAPRIWWRGWYFSCWLFTSLNVFFKATTRYCVPASPKYRWEWFLRFSIAAGTSTIYDKQCFKPSTTAVYQLNVPTRFGFILGTVTKFANHWDFASDGWVIYLCELLQSVTTKFSKDTILFGITLHDVELGSLLHLHYQALALFDVR